MAKTTTAPKSAPDAEPVGMRTELAALTITDDHHIASQRIGHSAEILRHQALGALSDAAAVLRQIAKTASPAEAVALAGLIERLS